MKSANRSMFAIIYLMINITCVGISTYATWEGFKSIFGVLSAPVAGVIGLTLFAANTMLREDLRSGIRPVGALTMLIVAMCASSVSNFNFFYTYALTDRVASDTLLKANDQFNRIMLRLESSIDSAPSVAAAKSRRDQVEAEIRALRAEAADRNEPGIGVQALGHIENLKRLLPNAIADLRPPATSAAPEVVKLYVADVERLVFEELVATEARIKATGVRDQVEQAKSTGAKIFLESNQLPMWASKGKVEAIDKLEFLARETTTSVNQAVADAGGKRLDAKEVEPVRGIDARLGEIVFSLRSGFIERPYPGYSAFALLASIGVDIIPLLFAIFLIRPERRAAEPRGAGAIFKR